MVAAKLLGSSSAGCETNSLREKLRILVFSLFLSLSFSRLSVAMLISFGSSKLRSEADKIFKKKEKTAQRGREERAKEKVSWLWLKNRSHNNGAADRMEASLEPCLVPPLAPWAAQVIDRQRTQAQIPERRHQ